MAGTWGTLTSAFPGASASTMLLLTDGRVLCQDSSNGVGSPDWYALTPSASGSYAAGTWAQVASGPNSPQFYASAVLADGRVLVAGGEFNGSGTTADLDAVEIYDPVANTWTAEPTPPGWTIIGDAPCAVLADGTFLLGRIGGNVPAIFSPAAGTWTATGTKLNQDSEEEAWALLPDGSVLTIDCRGHPGTERYVPGLNTWFTAGNTVTDLVSASLETGPAILLGTGGVLALGATGNNGLYTPPVTPAGAGTWAAGPAMPVPAGATGPMAAGDAPACLLPNGKVLCTAGDTSASGGLLNAAPTYFYEYDPAGNGFTQVTAPANGTSHPFKGRLLLLPNGQVLYTAGTTTVAIYTPDGSPLPAAVPVISSAPAVVTAGTTFSVAGTGLNGQSQACMYGDDASQATNYPLVSLASGGQVVYCRTHGHSSMGVAVTGTVTTNADVPANCPPGTYQLRAIANGIASSPVTVTVTGDRQVTLINNFAGGTAGQTVSPGNSGGASGQAFDTSAVTAGQGTCAYDTTHIPPGQSMAAQVATTGAGTAYVGWTASLTSPNGATVTGIPQAWFRVYVYVPGAVTVNTTVFAAFQSGAGTCGTVKLTTAGTVTFADNTGTVRVTTAAFPLAQWFRLEGFITGDPAAGQLNLVLYDTADSTVPDSAPATATGLNTLGPMTGWRYGQATALASAGPYWMANVGLSSAGYLGPTPLGFTSVRADGGGAITNVAVAPAAPAAPAAGGVLVGCTSLPNVYPGANTEVKAAQAFDGAVGEPMAVTSQKFFSQTGAVTAPSADMLAMAATGCQMWFCVKPAVSGADLTAMVNSLNAWLHPPNNVPASQIKVVIYQEVQDQTDPATGNPVTASDYAACCGHYVPTLHSMGIQNVYCAAGHAGAAAWLSYYPGDAGCDIVGVDFYGATFVQQYNGGANPDPLQPIWNLAATHGKPFAIPEIGSAIVTSTNAVITNANFRLYLNYLTSLYTAGHLTAGVMWYTSDSNSPVVNAVGGPNITAGAGSSGVNVRTWTTGSPGTLIASGNITSAGFGTGGRAGQIWVQCDDGTVVRLLYSGIGGQGGNPAPSNQFTGVSFLEEWDPVRGGSGGTTVSSGNLIAVWAFNNGVTSDFRIPLLQSFYTTLTTRTTAPPIAAIGDVEGFFTSADQGNHWQAASTGVYGLNWRRCAGGQWAITGEGSNVLYACTGLNGSGGGFLASVNGGASWSMRTATNAQPQFSGNTTNYPGTLPADQGRAAGTVLAQVAGQDLMYAASYSAGVYRSKGTSGSPNFGHTWVNIGLAGGTHFGRSIAVDPSNPANVFASYYNEGVYNTANAATGSPATWTLQATSPAFAEQLVILSSGNVYVAGGSGTGGGLWATPASGTGSGTWSQVGGALTATTPLSSSSYWLGLDGYTDAAGNDQLVIGCNSPVKGPGGAYRSLMWVTVPAGGGAPVFTDITDVAAQINTATIPPDGRTWWHTDTAVPNPSQATGFANWLGGAAYFQPHPVIDKSTINTSNVTIYVAGASGVFSSTGNTVPAASPYGIHATPGNAAPQPPFWNLAVNGLDAYVAHQVVADPGNPLHLAWATRDWGAAEVFDGAGYNAAALTQWSPAGANTGGFACAIDPATGVTFLATGTKGGADTNGQIWSRNNSFAPSNVSAGGTGGAPYAAGTQNPGGNVAYGLFAGRDGSNNPYLLAMIQGPAATGGMYRFSGHSIDASGNVTGGTWARVNPVIASGGSGTANEPAGPQGPIAADPANAGIIYAFDQNSGLWRGTAYGNGTWTQIWAIVNNENRSGFIACNPAVPGELWLSYWTSASQPGGLFKISNANAISGVQAGVNTTQIAGIAMPGAIAIAPNGDVYCLSLPGPPNLSPNTQLMGSQNGGATWVPADNGSIAACASYPGNMVITATGRIYIATNANVIVYGYPAVPLQDATASMAAVAALAATAVDASGGVIPVSTSIAAIFALSAAPGGIGQAASVSLAAVVSLSGALTGNPLIVQAISGTSAFDYGLSSVEITTTEGNTLVVLAGWDLSTGPATAPMPAVYVSDSAGNYWYHVATTTAGVTGARCSAWICPNAMSIGWLSVSLTTFASSLAYVVLELSGMPSLYSLDCFDVTGAQSASSLMLNPGSTGDDDFAFAVMATGALTSGPAVPGPWQSLQSVTAGPSSPPGITPSGPQPGFATQASRGQVPALPGNVNPVTIYPYFQVPAEGTSLATTFALDQAVPAAAVVFAVRSTVFPPLQQNPGMPVIKVEAGFGSVPGDPSQAPPSWTDITDRVIAPDGGTWVKTASGRQYELAQAEAGTMEIWVNNADGALTPGNTASVYAPGTGVVLGTPVHVSAYWAGRWYHIGYGWAERWPQEWPDLPQWGISKMIATDAIAVLAAVTMASALEGDILLDAPYGLLPAAEQYLSFSNGVTGTATAVPGTSGPFVLGSYSTADAQGLNAQNYSRSNQRPGMYADGNGAATGGNGNAIAATGQTTNLLGSSGTGFGTSAITTAPASPSSGPGIIYTDPNVPDPSTGFGVSVSFWLAIPPQTVSATIQPTVFSAYGPPSNYRTTPSLTVQVLNFTGRNLLQVTLADGSSTTVPFTPSSTAQQVTLILTPASLFVYVNGALEASQSLTAAQTTPWLAVSLGCPNYAYGTTGVTSGSFTAWDLAIYAYPLPAQRAVSQYATGLFGQQNVDATTRVAQLLAWAGIGLPRAGRQTFNGIPDGVTQGPAYNLAGATCSDAVNQVAVNHSAMVAAMPSGALTYIHRWQLFNQSPVAVFGDNPDPAQGQVPFVAGQSWGYDNTYLYNIASVTQTYGPNNLFTVTGADFTSQSEYFARSAIQQTISTMSNLDAANLMSWLIAKYGQPSLRVSTVTIDAASNPQAAFPAILPLLQGQVATVTRTPVGGVTITQTCLTQRIAHSIGPNQFVSALQLSPWTLESSILTLDEPGFDAAGSTALA